jgi:hypothetical protein
MQSGVNMAKEEKRESGQPGGGAGRRDDVRGSRVYPFNENAPKDAKVQPAGSFGQGERGGAGYEDHGSSELTDMGGTVVGGYSEPDKNQKNLEGERREQTRDISRAEWPSFLNGFSREHHGWLSGIEIFSGNDHRVEARNKGFRDISCDRAEGHERVYIGLGEAGEDITHEVVDPKRIRFVTTENGAHAALEVQAGDGTRTVIRFRTPGRPEELDLIA